MKITFTQFVNNTNNLDKLLITLTLFFPILLSTSIFLADLFASISALIILCFLFFKKKREIFSKIRFETYFFLIFYLIILISLIFSSSFKESFLPSFFYFRYFLFAVGIFYLFEKYSFFSNMLFYSLIITFSIIVIDSLLQSLLGENIFGYKLGFDGTFFVTSFFDQEKKLGSYFVRLLPMILAFCFFFDFKKYTKYIVLVFGFFIFLSSERTALFLYMIILFFYFCIIKNKIKILAIFLFAFFIIFSFGEKRSFKFIGYTLQQFGFEKTVWNQSYFGKIRYFSKEHEDLALTSILIFKDNYFNGNGIKTFHKTCELYKEEEKQEGTKYLEFLERGNNLACSTHPHNTYLQILSEVGIFGFLMIFYLFVKTLITNFKIILSKNYNNIIISYYFINLGIIINLFPLIPSGSFFNNWLSLILFYPLGFWLFLNKRYNEKIICGNDK